MKDKNITVGSVWHDIMGCNIRNVIVMDITNTGNEILISYKDKSGLTDMTFKRSKESFLMNFGRGEIEPIIFFTPSALIVDLIQAEQQMEDLYSEKVTSKEEKKS